MTVPHSTRIVRMTDYAVHDETGHATKPHFCKTEGCIGKAGRSGLCRSCLRKGRVAPPPIVIEEFVPTPFNRGR